MPVANSITELIGRTPLVRLNTLGAGLGAAVVLKLEMFNPMSSVKDRIGLAMIEAAEADGRLKPGATIIEPTSGNAGIALAFIAAAKGYKIVLTMPDTFSIERRKLLAALGADLVLTPGMQGMQGAVAKAQELQAKTPGSFIPMQFSNPANPEVHYRTTGPEIWQETGGQVHAFVAGVGTGGTVSGVGRYLKEQNPAVKIFAVEPDTSRVLSGGQPGAHKLQGLGAGFVPDNFNRTVVDEVLTVGHEAAGQAARRLAAEEGILGGISTGANLVAALELARRPDMAGKTIVTVACDTGERYLSTWLFGD